MLKLTWRDKMKAITSIIASCLLIGSSFVYAGQGPGPAAGGGASVAPMPNLMQEALFGRPDIAADGINNASQVDDPTEIGRNDFVPLDTPEPLPIEGSAGTQVAK
jgi:hypothetical protein